MSLDYSQMEQDLFVRINGTSSSAALVSQTGVCTSCSIYSTQENNAFHLLVGAGPGVAGSVKKGERQLQTGKTYPDAILITHSHRDQTSELSQFASGSGASPKIYCTRESIEQITKDFPSLAPYLSSVTPGQTIEIGPFSVLPIPVDHTGDAGSVSGSVIYVIRKDSIKMIMGWDFLKLDAVDNNKILWNPDLLILGTETYNDHPSTGVISISEAYNIIRRWNATECFIVGYNGQKDIEDARNQWFRGPTRPLSPDELQTAIDDHLRVTGDGGKFSVTVAKEGMIWKPQHESKHVDQAIGDSIEIEGIEKYVFKLDKLADDGLRVTVEDSIHRLESEFTNPHATDGGKVLSAHPVKGFMTKGPELDMSVIPLESAPIVKLRITRGKKPLVADDIPISIQDAQRLIKYINQNFASSAQTVASI